MRPQPAGSRKQEAGIEVEEQTKDRGLELGSLRDPCCMRSFCTFTVFRFLR